MLHYSIYNRTVTLPDGTKGVYNFVTGQKLLLKGFTEALYNSVTEAPGSRFAAKWLRQGFLAEGDETVKLRLLHNHAMSSPRHLGLTVCPTRNCNFRCPYCFEQHTGAGMPEEVQEKLIAFVRKFFEENHPESFSVSWFGGEPLLYPRILEHLSAEFLALSEEYNVKYTAGVVTNGYFFTQKNVDLLEAAHVGRVQITLDGPREQNDRTRILADGRGSYDVIMDNLRAIRTKMRIHVRCNTNTENRAAYQELEDTVKALKEATGNDLSSYPAYMDETVTADRSRLEQRSLDYDGYLEQEKSSMLHSIEDLKYRPVYCTSQSMSSFVVRDDGRLCKCWNDVTMDERVVASLLEDRNPVMTQLGSEWGQKYLGLDLFEDPECRECRLLPVCCGGCPAKHLSGQKECIKKLEKKIDELIIRSFAEPEKQA